MKISIIDALSTELCENWQKYNVNKVSFDNNFIFLFFVFKNMFEF